MPVFFFIILFRNIILSYDKSYDFILNIYLHTLEILDVNMHPYFKYIFHIFFNSLHYIMFITIAYATQTSKNFH